MKSIYLDYSATTPVDERVLEEMLPYFSKDFGNSSSKTHTYGIKAAEAVEIAREKTANLINAEPEEIFFTGSATESINLAIKGIVEAVESSHKTVIASSIEHSSVMDTFRYLNGCGIETKTLKVDGTGIIIISDLKQLINNDTVIVSVMTANNEIGSIQPVSEIAEICRARNVIFHTDATQAAGKIPFDVKSTGADLVSFSAHKIYGPKGIGALYINKKIKNLIPQIHGGGHERGLRSGTLNVPAIVGFGKAAELCSENLFVEYSRDVIRRDRIIQNILQNCEGTILNGHTSKRIPNNINITFPEITNSVFINEFREFAVSFGSACSSETLEPSYVLLEIGRDKNQVSSSVRLSIGRFTTEEEVDYIIKRIPEGINKLK